MTRTRSLGAAAALLAAAIAIASACQVASSPRLENDLLTPPANRLAEVMTSAFCGSCHPAIYAEHEQNTHGRAFTDEEVRLATGRFGHGDCIRCHTPRPIFESGIGMNPMRRHHNLEEGNTCMTCHLRPDVDYSNFEGGPDCKTAFHPDVGTVEACASCHRNHGTPYQWELAPNGKKAKRKCMTCHMELVTRPVAVGEPPTKVRSHVFPGSRSESQLRRAYDYEARIEGNEVVVVVTNSGVGHNFPTELKQRSVESLIVVRDDAGKETARSRMVFRDPYKRPYGLTLPVNTQIPAGESREHRVPISISSGVVDCELHFKLYYPIEDHHSDLARRLETRRLSFTDIDPSTEPVEPQSEVAVVVPESIPVEVAGPANLIDYARHTIDTVEIDIPAGSSAQDIEQLILLFQFPVPEGNKMARERLAEIGTPAIPALIETLGSWDNKTWKQGMKVLAKIGAEAEPAVLDAMDSDELYVRIHARGLVSMMRFAQKDRLFEALEKGLQSTHPLDRSSSAAAIGVARGPTKPLHPLLSDRDPDVVRAAALALAHLDDRSAVDSVVAALRRAPYAETRRDLAKAAGMLGSPLGVPVLLGGLDHRDDLIRESFFESLFAVTGRHFGYDPLMPRELRLEAISELQRFWAKEGGADQLRRPHVPDPESNARAWRLVSQLGGGAGIVPGGEDRPIVEELVAMGADAVPSLVLGLKFPAGFASKRALICECLGRIGNRAAAPALASTLRDPVLAVASWACWALEGVADPTTREALSRYQSRLLSMAAAGRVPESVGNIDHLLIQAARTRLVLGATEATQDLTPFLLASDAATRRLAIDALQQSYSETRGYDPDGSEVERREAASRWNQ